MSAPALRVHLNLPVQAQSLGDVPRLRLWQENEQLLQACHQLQSQRGAEPNPSPELQTLQAQLQLLQLGLARLLGQRAGPDLAVQLHMEGLQLALPNAGSPCVLELQLPDVPWSLRLPVQQQADDAQAWLWLEPPPSWADVWGMTLFRLHRRSVAAQRHGSVDASPM